jgi:capsular exopolysaccharide synthesis family protein
VTTSSENQDAYSGGLFSQERVKSYASLLTGEEISRRVAQKLDPGNDPAPLTGTISATAEPETVVLVVSATDTSASRARQIAQATAEVFVDYVAELETPPGKSTAPIKASIVDRATEPGSPISPQPTRNISLALILGLLVGAGLAVLRDTTDTRIKTTQHVNDATGNAPVLGNIHFDKSAAKAPLVVDIDSQSPRAEAFRVLRTNLQFVNVDDDHQLFVVTSAVPGEGKSTTVCNLAITMAAAGQNVLLIEGDLRRPRTAAYLGLENTVGVTTVLVGRVTLDEAVQTVVPGCVLLATGTPPPNPSELLQSGAMRRLLAEAREEYDVVLIDAPPLLPVTDAAILAAQSDGAILVVHHGSTTTDQVAGAVARLEAVDARLVGTVISMAPSARRDRSGYGSNYTYGYTSEPQPPATPPSRPAKRAKKRKHQAMARRSQS